MGMFSTPLLHSISSNYERLIVSVDTDFGRPNFNYHYILILKTCLKHNLFLSAINLFIYRY